MPKAKTKSMSDIGGGGPVGKQSRVPVSILHSDDVQDPGNITATKNPQRTSLDSDKFVK